MNILLWVLQILFGLLFVFAGVSKFFMSADDITTNLPPGLSPGFIYFIGVCEALGGIGLVVPWATGIMPKLTPIAALGLVIIMIGAAVITAPMGISMAIFPAVIGVLCAFIAYGRGLRSSN